MIDTAPAPVAVPMEPTTPIKPSEALRLGRLLRPKPCGRDTLAGPDMACAMGAMAVGWGYSGDDDREAFIFASRRLMELRVAPSSIWMHFDAAISGGHPDPDSLILADLESLGL